jgi:hypothetical protein
MPRIAAVKMIIPSDAPIKPLAMIISATGALVIKSSGLVRPSKGVRNWFNRPTSEVDHPQPQQNVEERAAHAGQQPDTAKEAAGYLVERGCGECQHDPECDIEDGQRSKGVDKGVADNLRQAPVALEDFQILLSGEFADAQGTVEVGERLRNVDQDRDHKEQKFQRNRRAEELREIGPPAPR